MVELFFRALNRAPCFLFTPPVRPTRKASCTVPSFLTKKRNAKCQKITRTVSFWGLGKQFTWRERKRRCSWRSPVEGRLRAGIQFLAFQLKRETTQGHAIQSIVFTNRKIDKYNKTEPRSRLRTSSRFRKMRNKNTHPALQISCQKSWKRVPRLYVVLAEWECGAPSCVLSVVLDPSPSLCTSI